MKLTNGFVNVGSLFFLILGNNLIEEFVVGSLSFFKFLGIV